MTVKKKIISITAIAVTIALILAAAVATYAWYTGSAESEEPIKFVNYSQTAFYLEFDEDETFADLIAAKALPGAVTAGVTIGQVFDSETAHLQSIANIAATKGSITYYYNGTSAQNPDSLYVKQIVLTAIDYAGVAEQVYVYDNVYDSNEKTFSIVESGRKDLNFLIFAKNGFGYDIAVPEPTGGEDIVLNKLWTGMGVDCLIKSGDQYIPYDPGADVYSLLSTNLDKTDVTDAAVLQNYFGLTGDIGNFAFATSELKLDFLFLVWYANVDELLSPSLTAARDIKITFVISSTTAGNID